MARPTVFPACWLLGWIFLRLATVETTAADWPHWRGPQRNDHVSEPSGWDGQQWPLDDAWTANVGEGSSSPLVIGNRLYCLGSNGNAETLSCLNAGNGGVVWQQSTAAPLYGRHSIGDKGIYSGPSSTPEYDASTGYLYSLGIDGDLRCWDTRRSGREVWSINLYDRFGAPQRPDVGGKRGGKSRRDYGYTSSPLVLGDTLIVEVGDVRAGTVKGFDRRSGSLKWSSQVKDEAGHSGGPVPITVDGVPCLAILTMRNLVIMRTDDQHAGETIVTYPWTTDFANNIPTPAVLSNSVLITTAYNRYAMCRLDVTLRGATKVWESDQPSGVCSPVIHDGHVYWAWRGVHCVDWQTGKEVWRGDRVGTAGSCLVTDDDRLVVWADRGNLSLVETARRSPAAYTELSRFNGLFRRDAWPHVVLAQGRFYCKDRDGNLKCLVVKGGD